MSALAVAESEKRSPDGRGSIVTERWVEKVRRQHGRNPADGRPKSAFLKLDEHGRREKAAIMHADGMSYRAAAKRVGVSKQTMERYWPFETTDPQGKPMVSDGSV
jgi:hypothetical protein